MKLKIKNLDCPNCAKELERELSTIVGVKDVTVDFMNQVVKFDYDNKNVIETVKSTINNFEDVKIVEEEIENTSHKKEIIKILLSVMFFALSLILKNVFSMEHFNFNLIFTKYCIPYVIMLLSTVVCYF